MAYPCAPYMHNMAPSTSTAAVVPHNGAVNSLQQSHSRYYSAPLTPYKISRRFESLVIDQQVKDELRLRDTTVEFYTEPAKRSAARLEHELYHVRLCANALIRQQALLAHALEQLWIDEQTSRARAELDALDARRAAHDPTLTTEVERYYAARLHAFLRTMGKRRANIAIDCDVERHREREEDAELMAEMMNKMPQWRQAGALNAKNDQSAQYAQQSAVLAKHPALRPPNWRNLPPPNMRTYGRQFYHEPAGAMFSLYTSNPYATTTSYNPYFTPREHQYALQAYATAPRGIIRRSRSRDDIYRKNKIEIRNTYFPFVDQIAPQVQQQASMVRQTGQNVVVDGQKMYICRGCGSTHPTNMHQCPITNYRRSRSLTASFIDRLKFMLSANPTQHHSRYSQQVVEQNRPQRRYSVHPALFRSQSERRVM